MSGPTLADLSFVVPELILVGAALVLILVARRVQRSPFAAILTVVAGMAAAWASGWLLPEGDERAFGGLIVLDGYARFFKVLIAASLVLVALLAMREEERPVRRGEYNALLLLASTGMMFAATATDLLTFYLALELTTLCAYILVGITVDRTTSNEAAIKYFLLGSVASALLLFGISLTYGLTGATDYSEVAASLSGGGSDLLPLVAIALVLAGLAFKVAAVPFHSWAPDAYQGASAPVAAFLAAGSKAAGLAALGRICMTAFGAQAEILTTVLAALAGLSIIAGSLTALAQTDMKRLLAYSSIAHVGYALLGLADGSEAGASATMTYAFFYVFMTLGAFGVIITLGDRGKRLDGYEGLAAQRPGLAAAMLLFLLSLTGIPLTAGFAAKFVVIESALRAGFVALAVLAVVCTVVSAFVYMRVAVLMYMREPSEEAPPRLPASVCAALAVAALVTLIGGVLPGVLAAWTVSP